MSTSIRKLILSRFVRSLSRRARRFDRDESGSSAVEFAIVALPFIAVVVAIIELSLTLLANESLDLTARIAGRLVMTGQAQTAAYTAATYRTAVCNDLSVLFSCDDLYINVATYSSFSSASVTPTYTSTGQLDTSSLTYSPGTAGSVVVIQLYYQWPIVFSIMNSWLINQTTTNSHLLIATCVVQNEPYQ